ncbi:fibronectin type III domain-containing protein [Abyssalbus ytuae]|uniref:Fibronectin type III domain-containing protein n=1 Tax=Abyssalbus ytuae TaxID=2926907 RepID=A0A9E6ZQZ2_9FLAO|nr:fibronectin type III domain-containing protein [Abyssalbus ytuae]UOB18945.1 fibronectin type III domain-containing protein [Abyssalbus ytuae]
MKKVLALFLVNLVFIFSCTNDDGIENDVKIDKVDNLISTNQTAFDITISWSPGTNSNIISYNIFRDNNFLTNTSGTTFTDTNLNEDTSYSYQVSAVDSENNEGPKSNVLVISTKSNSNSEDYEFVFNDGFEGDRDNTFWLGEGVYINYGVEDPNDPLNKVMKMSYIFNSEGEGDSWTEYDFALPIEATQIEMSFDMYTPENYLHFENNHKLYALWSGTYGKTNAWISVSSEMWGVEGGASPSIYVGIDQNNFGHAMLSDRPLILEDHAGSWSTYKIYLKLSENDGDYGILELYKDGVLVTSTNHPNLTKPYSGAPEPSEIIRYAETGNYIDQGTLLGWANGDPDRSYNQDIHFLIDNFSLKAK